MVTKRELQRLGVEDSEIITLNDKWYAIFYPNPSNPSEGIQVLRETSGHIAAQENLIDLQMSLPDLLTTVVDSSKVDPSYIRRHISFRHIPRELDHLS